MGWGVAEPLSPQEPSLYTVKALLILDSLGQRLLAKVNPAPPPASVSPEDADQFPPGSGITPLPGCGVLGRPGSDSGGSQWGP